MFTKLAGELTSPRRTRHAKGQRPLTLESLECRALLAAMVDLPAPEATLTYESPLHVFSMDDVVGGFDGATFAQDPTIIDTSAMLEDPNNPDPPNYTGPVRAIQDNDGNILYPIDSEFGFVVEDFVGAEEKVRDGYYSEGWAGNLVDDQGQVIGLNVADAPTDTFSAGLPLGTWSAGLGGNSVKASTEHYVVMQDILSDQGFPGDPNAAHLLDNDLVIIGGPYDGQLAEDVIADLQAQYDGGDTSVDVFPPDAPDGVIDIRDVLAPNENTILEDIAASDDYSVTLKDDGKLLYRWGTIVKRPNDIRLTTHLALPSEWLTPENQAKNGGKGLRVTGAELHVSHTITNNPNDQIRPEDLENEAATGRLPSYEVIQHPDFPGDPNYELWVSPVDDFKGDGTYLPSYFQLDEFGQIVTTPQPGDVVAYDHAGQIVGVVNTDTLGTPVGTVLREVGPVDHTSTTLLSEDLADGFREEWYTTMDRDPFEAVFDSQGEYVVGPRWRLKPNKFGQDIPGVEIPAIPHSQPPFTHGNVKYPTGELTTTVINLLDWEPGETSPLAYSNGWTVDTQVTGNGLQLSNEFDVAYYVKGDAKPAHLYNAQLFVEYDDGTTFACDFDGTGTCDIDDIDALVTEIVAGTNDPLYDLTGDGSVDLADRDQWLADAGAMNLPSGNPYLLGDSNLDATVDGADFLDWNDNKFQSTGLWSKADWNADGTTDGQDFLHWNDNKFLSADQTAPLVDQVFEGLAEDEDDDEQELVTVGLGLFA